VRTLLLALWLVACQAAAPTAAPPTPIPTREPPSQPAPVAPSAKDSIELAITVDDLPRHGPDVPGVTRLSIHQRVLDTFTRHRTPPVYGFINARSLEAHPEDREALAAWLAAGHPLGNHSYSHPDLFSGMSDQRYLEDVWKNEPTLEALAGKSPESVRSWKLFRYPYLREGRDLASRAMIRRALQERGYRLAPVTIDFFDWAYQPAYARCLEKKDQKAIAVLKESYLDHAAHELLASDEMAKRLLGRPIKHILLLHVGHFTSLMLDELLTSYEKNGAKLVSLDEALEDPVYRDEPREPKVWAGNLLTQIRKARELRSPTRAPPPDTLLDFVCR
jgi:peptidoglycan/xylan/chitin deacetylase (PgdA/CDA1 family)